MGGGPLVPREYKYDNTLFWIQYGVDLEKRRVMIDEEVDEISVGWIIRGVRKMIDIDDTSPIDVYVNSYGGVCYDGFALFDFLESLDYVKVRTWAIGKVMSMGFAVFMVGDERRAYPRARFMHHEVASWVPYSKTSTVKIEYEEMQHLEKQLGEILGDRTQKDSSWWANYGRYTDKYFDPERAYELGVLTHKDLKIKKGR